MHIKYYMHTLLMSLVNTPEASPNSVALALLKTPSISLHALQECNSGEEGWEGRAHPFSKMDMIMTGPKDSSWAMKLSSSTFVKMVGSIKKPAHTK